jgi:hypothetical protein
MANKKISELTSATSVSGSDILPIVQSSTTKTSTVALVAAAGIDDTTISTSKAWSSNKVNLLFNNKVSIYKKADRAFSTAFTATGTVTYTSGNVNYSGSGGASLDLNDPASTTILYHAYEHWEVRATIQLNSMANNDAGFNIGMRANTGLFGFRFKAHPADGNTVLISLVLNNTLLTLLGQFSYTNGDSVNIIVRRERNVLTTIVQNQGGIVQTFQGHWGEGQPSSYNAPTITCDFAIDFLQGNFALTDYTVLTKDFGKDVLFVGDSITDGVGATFYTMAWPRLIESTGHNTATYAMPSATIAHTISMLPAIKLISPKKVVLLIGANNYINIISLTTTKADYSTLVTGLESAGIEVVICLLTPLDGFDVRPLNTWLLQTFTGRAFIDFFTGMADSGTFTLAAPYDSGDGVHPGNAAQPYMQKLAEQTLFYYGEGLRIWTGTTAPTVADIPGFQVVGWWDTAAGTVKLFFHDGTTLKSVTLT